MTKTCGFLALCLLFIINYLLDRLQSIFILKVLPITKGNPAKMETDGMIPLRVTMPWVNCT